MKTTLTIIDEVCEAAWALARSRGERLRVVVSELVHAALTERPANPIGDDELPHFEVSEGAALIPGERATELMADEGLGRGNSLGSIAKG